MSEQDRQGTRQPGQTPLPIHPTEEGAAELFEAEFDASCHGLRNFPEELYPGLIHAVIRELKPSFRRSITRGVAIDVLDLARKIEKACASLVGLKEAAYSICTHLPRPDTLDGAAQFTVMQVVQRVEDSFPGLKSKVFLMWTQAAVIECESVGKDPGSVLKELPSVPISLENPPRHAVSDYQDPTPMVFLSHSSRDKEFCRELARELNQNFIRVWLDEQHLLGGDALTRRFQEAISWCKALIVVISSNSIESRWVRKEIEIARDHYMQGNSIEIIPIALDSARLPEELYLDDPISFEAGIEQDAVERLIHVITGDPDWAEDIIEMRMPSRPSILTAEDLIERIRPRNPLSVSGPTSGIDEKSRPIQTASRPPAAGENGDEASDIGAECIPPLVWRGKINPFIQELFDFEFDGLCYGIANFPGEFTAGLIHQSIASVAKSLRTSIDLGYPFDVFTLADKISRACLYTVHECEIATSICSQLPAPHTLRADTIPILDAIIDHTEARIPGIRDRLHAKWAREARGDLIEASAGEQAASNPEPWFSEKPSVLLVASAEDSAPTLRVQAALETREFQVRTIDVSNLSELSATLAEREFWRGVWAVLPIVSQGTVQAEWVSWIVERVRSHNTDRPPVHMIPIRSDGCGVTAAIAHVFSCDLVDVEESLGWDSLVQAITGDPGHGRARINLDLAPGPTLICPEMMMFPDEAVPGERTTVPEREKTPLFTVASELTERDISVRIARLGDELKASRLIEPAATWWTDLLESSADQPAKLLRLLEEVQVRGGSLAALYTAHIYSRTNDAACALTYMSFMKVRDK